VNWHSLFAWRSEVRPTRILHRKVSNILTMSSGAGGGEQAMESRDFRLLAKVGGKVGATKTRPLRPSSCPTFQAALGAYGRDSAGCVGSLASMAAVVLLGTTTCPSGNRG
jgi:hypothetical protein